MMTDWTFRGSEVEWRLDGGRQTAGSWQLAFQDSRMELFICKICEDITHSFSCCMTMLYRTAHKPTNSAASSKGGARGSPGARRPVVLASPSPYLAILVPPSSCRRGAQVILVVMGLLRL